MKHKSKDVTTPTRPRYDRPPDYRQPPGAVVPSKTIPPTSQSDPRPLPPVEPATIVSGESGAGIKSSDIPRPNFRLPETVSAEQIRQESFRYGGGRSAGRQSTKL
jgi:hypothetical protein